MAADILFTLAVFVCSTVSFIYAAASGESCHSGRIYLGNFNLTFVDHLPYMGVFVKLASRSHHNRPVYKHQQHNLYMYFIVGHLESRWIIQPNVTDDLSQVTVSSSSASREPLSSQNIQWRLKFSGEWRTIKNLKTVCVPPSFGLCTSGSILISGLSSKTRIQSHFLGRYTLRNVTSASRPVYSHHASEATTLFFKHGLWIFKRDLNSTGISMFNRDPALFPEFVIQPWTVFNGFGFRSETLAIKCMGLLDGHINRVAVSGTNRKRTRCRSRSSKDLPPPGSPLEGTAKPDSVTMETRDDSHTWQGDDPASTGSSRLLKVLLSTPAPSPEEVEECDEPTVCANGGESFRAGHGLTACHCKDGYFGPQCETEIECRDPPVPRSTLVRSMIHTGFLTLAFYGCEAGFFIRGSNVAVCGPMTEGWHDTPQCVTYMPLGRPD